MKQESTIEVSPYPTHGELGRALSGVAALMRSNYRNLYPGMSRWEIWLYSHTARSLEILAKRFS